MSFPPKAAIISFQEPISRTSAGRSRFSQKPPSSLTSSRQPSSLARSSMAMTVRWQRRKLGTPPHLGLLAYCVLQNELQCQPDSPVLSGPRGVSITAGYWQSPKLAASQPSPGQVSKAISREGMTSNQVVYPGFRFPALGFELHALGGLNQQPAQRVILGSFVEVALLPRQFHHLAQFFERQVLGGLVQCLYRVLAPGPRCPALSMNNEWLIP